MNAYSDSWYQVSEGQGSRGSLFSIWDICPIAIIIAYFFIYLREKEGNKDKDADKDR